jgi:hypothetical protein
MTPRRALALIGLALLMLLGVALWWTRGRPGFEEEQLSGASLGASGRPGSLPVLSDPRIHLPGEEPPPWGEAPPPQEAREGLAEEEPPLEVARLKVRVLDSSGALVAEPTLHSFDCGVTVGFENTGQAEVTVPAGLCHWQARRSDGALSARSDWVELRLEPDQLSSLDLVLPAERTGGLGVQIAEHDLGIQIVAVNPGTPASEMGLTEGEVIIEADGESTTDMEIDEFIEILTGPEGSKVDFVILDPRDTGDDGQRLTLTRRYIGN